jgi:hypothetical protein
MNKNPDSDKLADALDIKAEQDRTQAGDDGEAEEDGETICCGHCGHEYDRHIGDECPNCGHNNHEQYEEKYGQTETCENCRHEDEGNDSASCSKCISGLDEDDDGWEPKEDTAEKPAP